MIPETLETIPPTRCAHHLVLLPLLYVTTVAAPFVHLICTPPVVPATLECNNGSRLELFWLWWCTITVLNTLDDPLIFTVVVVTIMAHSTSTLIPAPSVTTSTFDGNLAIEKLFDLKLLLMTKMISIATDPVMVIFAVLATVKTLEGPSVATSIHKPKLFPEVFVTTVTFPAETVVIALVPATRLCAPSVTVPTLERNDHSILERDWRAVWLSITVFDTAYNKLLVVVTIAIPVTANVVATVEAVLACPAAPQPHLTSTSLTIGEPFISPNTTRITPDLVAMWMVSAVLLESNTLEGNTPTTSIHDLVLLPLLNMSPVAIQTVFRCTPATVPATSDSNYRIDHNLDWCSSSAVLQTLHFVFPVLERTRCLVTSYTVAFIPAEPTLPATHDRNLVATSLLKAELLPLVEVTTVTDNAGMVVLICTEPLIVQASQAEMSTTSINNLELVSIVGLVFLSSSSDCVAIPLIGCPAVAITFCTLEGYN